MKAKVMSIILKSVLGGKSINEPICEIKDAVIDGLSETSMKHIEDFVDKSRDKLKNALSEENLEKLQISNTDYVIAEMKDILTQIKVDNDLLGNCQYNTEELNEFLWKYYKSRHGNIEMERDIQKGIGVVSSVIMDLFYKSEEFSQTLLIEINRNLNTANKKIDDTYEMLQKMYNKDKVYEMANLYSNSLNNGCIKAEEKPKNKASEYAKIWDENMFLNNFDKRDKKASKNVKLSEVYLDEHLPHYVWGNNDEDVFTDLKLLLTEYVDNKIDNKMLLILGQPGIGKSTLITWILASFKEEQDNILVYRFASDLKNVNWQMQDVAINILEKLELSYSSLEGKTIIFDGFDEINVGDEREKVLDLLYWQLVKNTAIKGLSLIITCRENYIQRYERVQCRYITLQPWDESQIRSFCKIFGEKVNAVIDEDTIENIIENKEVLGIPLILYMALSLNISFESDYSMVDVYDKVFSLNGGFYDRCIENMEFAKPHRIKKIKEQIHQVSKEIAIHIFENNPSGGSITQKDYKEICDAVDFNQDQQDVSIEQDVLIGNYFAKIKHCGGMETDEVYFIHRTIYEYFVAETIFCSIKDVLASPSDDEQETFIKNIVKFLKTGQINSTIGEFLKYKILKVYNSMQIAKKENFWKWLEIIVGKMMTKGMLCYIEKDMKRFDYVIKHEAICFRNVMYLMSLLSEVYPPDKYLLSTVDHKVKDFYLQLFSRASILFQGACKEPLYNLLMIKTDFSGFNLTYAVLKSTNLKNANLNGLNLCWATLMLANLENASLIGADLRDSNLNVANLIGANLEGANLKGAKLRGANLKFANLTNTNFVNTDLRNANFRNAHLGNTKLKYARLERSVWLEEDINKLMSQLEYAVFESLYIVDKRGESTLIKRDELFSKGDTI